MNANAFAHTFCSRSNQRLNQSCKKSVQAYAHDSARTGANLTRHDFGKTEGQPITWV